MLPFLYCTAFIWGPGAGTTAGYFLLCLQILFPSNSSGPSVPVPGHWQWH